MNKNFNDIASSMSSYKFVSGNLEFDIFVSLSVFCPGISSLTIVSSSSSLLSEIKHSNSLRLWYRKK